MDSIRKFGALLARHWEKAVLGVALVGLIYAVIHLFSAKQAEDDKIRIYDAGVAKRKTKAVPAVDIDALSKSIEHTKNPPSVDLGLPHNVFNPVKWQRRPDGTIIKIEKGTEVGPAALKITGTAPLNTVITLDKPSAGGLLMSSAQEAAPLTNAVLRRKLQSFVTTNSADRTKLFTLREIRGTAEKPEAVVELTNGERVTVTADKPYSRVDGFKVDLLYPPENRPLKDKRVDDVLTLAGEDYIIVAISSNEVVVSARSNNRRTTIRNNAAP
jgi:hypothetical protein